MPIFSVIVPAYNSEKFIRETLTSILDQTFTNFEVIVVDDGSSDLTPSILLEFQKKDTRVRIISIKNSGGPTVPTNIAISVAKGMYIAFLDHDDAWENSKLEKLYLIYTQNPLTGFILSNVTLKDEINNHTSVSRTFIASDKLSPEAILAGNYFNTFSMLSVRREILNQVGQLDTNLLMFADYEIIVRMLANNISHIFIQEPLVGYRIHQNNTSAYLSSRNRRIDDLEYIFRKHRDTFEEYPESASRLYRAIGRLNLSLGNNKEAQHAYKKSIIFRPYSIGNHFRLLTSYFGEDVYMFFRKIKNEALRKL